MDPVVVAGSTGPRAAKAPPPPPTTKPGDDIDGRRLVKLWLFLCLGVLLLTPDTLLRRVGLKAPGVSPGALRSPGPKREPLFVVYGDIEKYWGNYVVKEFFSIVHNLTTHKGWRRYVPDDGTRPSWEMMADHFTETWGRMPDVLLFLQDFESLDPRSNPRANDSALANTVVMNWWDDTPQNFRWGFICEMVDILMPTYEYLLRTRARQCDGKPRVWMPHSAMPAYMLPFNEAPKEKVLLVGSIDPAGYPLRWVVYNKILGGDTRFEKWEHPGWQPGQTDHQAQMAGAVRGYLAAICDATSGSYVVGKTFEIPATGTLLLIAEDIAQPMAALGFVNGTHYLAYNRATMDATVDWVLDPANRARVDAMRRAAQAVAVSRHQSFHRTETIHAAAVAVAGKGNRHARAWRLPVPFPLEATWGEWSPYTGRPDKLAWQERRRLGGPHNDSLAGEAGEWGAGIFRGPYDETTGMPRR